ncbi:MAG: hypothetical protein ACK4N1_09510 [Pseudorhizobium sp.]
MTQISHATFEPQELALLQRCYIDIYSKRRVAGGQDAANRLAAQILELYQAGVRDESELRARLADPATHIN